MKFSTIASSIFSTCLLLLLLLPLWKLSLLLVLLLDWDARSIVFSLLLVGKDLKVHLTHVRPLVPISKREPPLIIPH